MNLDDQTLTIIQDQISKLNSGLLESAPDIHNWMQELNLNIRANPHLIHLLKDEDRATLYQAVIAMSKIAIAPAAKPPKEPKAPKDSKGKGKAAKQPIQFDNLKPLDNLDFLL